MDSDAEEAKRLLQQFRDSQITDQTSSLSSASSSSSSSSWLSRKPIEGIFTYKEVNHVLSEVIDRDGPVGLVNALLEIGADVNYSRRKSSNIWKTICRKDQQSRRNDIFLRATIHCPPDVVQALADHADQANLDSVLHHAIARADLTILKALLDCGADPTDLHDDFENIVFRNELSLLELLLSGPKKPCLPCRSAGLRIAVKNQSPEAMRILLRHDADINHDDGAALLRAVDSLRPDFVSILISGPVRALAYSLDAAVGRAYVGMNGSDDAPAREIIDMCLAAGARGPEANQLFTRGLADMVKRGQGQLLETVLKFSKPAGEFETVAILEAIKTKQVGILTKFLEMKPSQLSLAAAVTQAMSLEDGACRLDAVRTLISHGAQGDSVANAFVLAVRLVAQAATNVQDADKRLFNLLLNEGKADVDYSRGEALQQAVKASSTDAVGQILSKSPSPESLGAALPLAMALTNREERQTLVHMLLQSRAPETAVNTSLVEAVKGGPENETMVQLLLSRASVNHNTGEAISCAIRNIDLKTARLLLDHQPNYAALETAVAEALRVPKTDRVVVMDTLIPHLHRDHLSWALGEVGTESDLNLDLLKSLLQAGADVTFHEGVCIRHAARNLDRDTILVLTEFSGPNEAIYTAALSEVITDGRAWIAPEHTELINILLKHGASGSAVDKALIEVVGHLAGKESQAELGNQLLDLLFSAGANVNVENGKSAGLAASRGDASMLRRLLGQDASVETASFAFSAAIFAHPEEHRLLELIDVFMDDGTTVPDVNTHLPGMPPPIFLCLKGYFDSTSLVERLVAIGCDLQVTVPRKIYADESHIEAGPTGTSDFPEEPISVLFWALLQPETKISSRVITTLINCGANVAYITPKSRITALMLAAKYGRPEVAEKLLKLEVKASARDALGRSALYYASRNGNIDTIRMLLEAKTNANDGSLHEASRGFHGPAMELLITAGHEANYRSAKHGGRTALAEMALKGRLPADVSTAEEALDILKKAGADPLCRVYGKSVIFLALDNSDPGPIASLLLEKILWKVINDDANVYQEEQFFYSPTMYITKKKMKESDDDVHTRFMPLLELLRIHGATDKYYAEEEHAQPADAVGVPQHIRNLERERRARQLQFQLDEEAHQAALRREAEQASNRARIAEAQHSPSLRHRGLDHKQEKHHHHRANHHVGEPGTPTRIERDQHRDREGMVAEKREADLVYRQRLHGLTVAEQSELEGLVRARKDRFVAQGPVHDEARFRQRVRQLEEAGVGGLRREGVKNDMALRHAASMNDEALRLQQRGNEAKLGLEKGVSSVRTTGRREGRRDEWADLVARDRVAAAREARVLGGTAAAPTMRMLEKQADGWKMVERVGPPLSSNGRGRVAILDSKGEEG